MKCKGKNIKSEVNKLFLKTTKRALKIQDKAVTISYDNTGNELFTRLKYNLELETLNPKFNFLKINLNDNKTNLKFMKFN